MKLLPNTTTTKTAATTTTTTNNNNNDNNDENHNNDPMYQQHSHADDRIDDKEQYYCKFDKVIQNIIRTVSLLRLRFWWLRSHRSDDAGAAMGL